MVAANPSEVGYDVAELDNALVDRVLHYAPGWDPTTWAKWARESGLSEAVIGFTLANFPGAVNVGESQLSYEINEKLITTPRAIEYFSALYEPNLSEGMLNVIATGLLGQQGAAAFIKQELSARPLTVKDLAEPYEYDETLKKWSADPESAGKIKASTISIMTHLLDHEVPEDLEHFTPQLRSDIAIISRYIARLSSISQEEAFALIDRSIPEWADFLKRAVLSWTTRMAQDNQLIGR